MDNFSRPSLLWITHFAPPRDCQAAMHTAWQSRQPAMFHVKHLLRLKKTSENSRAKNDERKNNSRFQASHPSTVQLQGAPTSSGIVCRNNVRCNICQVRRQTRLPVDNQRLSTSTTWVGCNPGPTCASTTRGRTPPTLPISRAALSSSACALRPLRATNRPPGTNSGKVQPDSLVIGATALQVTTVKSLPTISRGTAE